MPPPVRKVGLRFPRPFQVERLARVIGIDPLDTDSLARELGKDRKWIQRYRDRGLTRVQADEWALRVGWHPLLIWPDWWPK